MKRLLLVLIITMMIFSLSVSADNKEDAYNYFNQACTYFMQMRYEESLQLFDKAIKLDPSNNIFYRFKGNTYEAMKNFDKAIECYDKAASVKPESNADLVTKLKAQCNFSKYEDGIKTFEKIAEITKKYPNPSNDRNLLYAAQFNITCLIALNKGTEALACIDDLIKKDPKNSNNYTQRAMALQSLNKTNEALDACNKAIELNSTNCNAYAIKGLILTMRGKAQQALDIYNAVEKDDKINKFSLAYAELQFFKALTYAVMDKKSECFDSLRKAIEINRFSINYIDNYIDFDKYRNDKEFIKIIKGE